jgi:uncharacterized membrane protein
MSELHPLTVHAPLTLGAVWWVVDAVGLVTRRDDVSRVALGLLAAAFVSGLAATVTGQAAYDAAIAAGVAPVALDVHAERAELVPWALLALLVARVGGARRLGRPAAWAAVFGGVSVTALLVLAGHSGGELVFEHGVGVEHGAGLRAPVAPAPGSTP